MDHQRPRYEALELSNQANDRFRKRIKELEKDLNRRVDIENELFEISKGRKPIPTHEECKIMALKLGTPKEYWPKYW